MTPHTYSKGRRLHAFDMLEPNISRTLRSTTEQLITNLKAEVWPLSRLFPHLLGDFYRSSYSSPQQLCLQHSECNPCWYFTVRKFKLKLHSTRLGCSWELSMSGNCVSHKQKPNNNVWMLGGILTQGTCVKISYDFAMKVVIRFSEQVMAFDFAFYCNNQPQPRPHTEQTMRDTTAGNEKSRIYSRGLQSAWSHIRVRVSGFPALAGIQRFIFYLTNRCFEIWFIFEKFSYKGQPAVHLNAAFKIAQITWSKYLIH